MSSGIAEVYTWPVRFLRMLTNSLLGGALGAAYLTVVVLQLNPHVPLLGATAAGWYVTLALFYGLHLTVVFYLLLVGREFFTATGLSPGWASVRVLAWLSAASAAVAAAVMWTNLRGLAVALDEIALRRMTAGAMATTAAAGVLLGIAIAHYSFGRRGSRVGAALFAMAVFASIALPLAARGPAVERPPSTSPGPGVRTIARPVDPPAPAAPAAAAPRVVLLLLDGGSLEYIWTRTAEGRLPNFARLLESGASMDLATIRPTQPEAVWAAAATGRYPARNGIRSAASFYAWNATTGIDLLPDYCLSHLLVRFGVVRAEARSSADWRARAIWSILTDAEIPVGVMRWPLTYPAPPVQGFLVTERFPDASGFIRAFDDRAAYPADAAAIVRRTLAEADDPAEEDASRRAPDAPAPELAATRRDLEFARALRHLRAAWAPRFVAMRYQSLDAAGHRFAARSAAATGEISDEERRRRGQMLERAYAAVDGEVGAAIESLEAGDLLLIVSGFGMQRADPLKQMIAGVLGESEAIGTHDRAPDGFLLAYGTHVEPGRGPRGSIVDLAPTVLYFLGLPIGRDMDGNARTDLFRRGFSADRPIAFIPSYGS
jgi:predicted AlkP superfamily phosphohydrolase/phosphomutase